MKSKTATTWIIGIIFVLTVLLTFVQPSVIHQLVVWVSGSFAVLVALALFVVGNWPTTAEAKAQPTTDAVVLGAVAKLRHNGWDDATVASLTGFDIDVIKAIPQ